jgi:hypothetical protein
MLKTFVRNNKAGAAILLFLFIFMLVHMMKPVFLYNKDGSLREFGVGYKNKTFLPLWLFSIVLGILSYLAVSYYVVSHRIM